MRNFSVFLVLMAFAVLGCNDKKQPETTVEAKVEAKAVVHGNPTWTINPTVDQLHEMNQQFRDVDLQVPLGNYSEDNRRFLGYLVKAADVIDRIYWKQVSDDGQQVMQALNDNLARQGLSEAEKLASRLVAIHYGRFDRLDKHHPFIGSVEKPLGATFYPSDMTRQVFESWVKDHPDMKEALEDPYTVVRYTDGGKLSAISYAEFYRNDLAQAADYLDSASKFADSPSMADFLAKQAKAFRDNTYRESDWAWVKVQDSKFEVVIAPYETYEDRLFGYKAAFEAYIAVTDPKLSADLGRVKGYLDDMEKKIPLDEQYRGYQRASDSPIFAVDLFYSAGDGRRGVQTSAFNLPNDESVRRNAGTKKVMLRNVQREKFRLSLIPISRTVLVDSQQALVTWDSYFWHNLLHELSHGMGPGIIKVGGVETTVSKALKDTFGALEELKADAMGFWDVGYLVDAKFFPASMLDETAAMSLAGFFRAVRFGADEAHGVNNLIYYNFFKERGVYDYDPATKRFIVNVDKFLAAAAALLHEVLTIEATGDYQAAKTYMAKYGKMPPEAKDVLTQLGDIPVDIRPVYGLFQLNQ